MTRYIFIIFFLCCCSTQSNQTPVAVASTQWPVESRLITYQSSLDGTLQPAMFYAPPTANQVPLLVGLHTWRGWEGDELIAPLAAWSVVQSWAFISPNFRGPNTNPNATGSPLAVQDIIDAVAYARQHANIDPRRVYLVGLSGGGHAALLVAAQHPEMWAGVSVWVPITDLTAWHGQTLDKYFSGDIEASTGGRPGDSPAIDEEYRLRSPLTYLSPNLNLNIDINAGIYDSTVPVSHSLFAFNALAAPDDRLTVEQIAVITNLGQIPLALQSSPLYDSTYGTNQPLFRRASNGARLTIFNGDHEIIYTAAVAWLEAQNSLISYNIYLPIIQHQHS